MPSAVLQLCVFSNRAQTRLAQIARSLTTPALSILLRLAGTRLPSEFSTEVSSLQEVKLLLLPFVLLVSAYE